MPQGAGRIDLKRKGALDVFSISGHIALLHARPVG
jgi:hypothetical protein